MFSGRLPRALGLGQAPGGTPFGAAPVVEEQRLNWLPEILRQSGYRSAAVSANGWVSRASGFSLGFDEFVEIDTHRHASLNRGLRSRAKHTVEAVLAKVDDGAAEARGALRRLFESADTNPQFWFVNVIECHSPYMPPRKYNSLSPLARAKAAEDAARYLTLDSIWRACVGDFDIPQDALERMRRLYADSVRQADDWVGGVLDDLDAAGRLDDTLVIVSSDHGENLGEGGLIAHAYSLDERLIHVPMVTAGPIELGDGRPFSLADMPRRLCDGIGIAHPWSVDDLPQGVAVSQFDPAVTSPSDPRALEMVGRWGVGDDALTRFVTPLTCATDGRLKLLRRGHDEFVFDLVADPGESNPIAADDPSTPDVSSLRAALDHPAAVAVAEPDLSARSRAASGAAPEDEVARIEERMRLLGYM